MVLIQPRYHKDQEAWGYITKHIHAHTQAQHDSTKAGCCIKQLAHFHLRQKVEVNVRIWIKMMMIIIIGGRYGP